MERVYANLCGEWKDITDNGIINGEMAKTLLNEAKLDAVFSGRRATLSVGDDRYKIDSTCLQIVDTVYKGDVKDDNVLDSDNYYKQECEIWEFTNRLSTLKYDEECRREASLIEQSSKMQEAFGFYTAALYVIAPFIIQYTSSKIPIWFYGSSLSIITICILASLFCATIVQRRRLHNAYPSVDAIERKIRANFDGLSSATARYIHANDYLRQIEADLTAMNDKRVKWVEWASYLFISAVIITTIAFMLGLLMVIFKEGGIAFYG
jgi:uncharacterized membrane protein